MYYCHDCKHWHKVYAYSSDGHDRECGLCSMIFDDLPVEAFFKCKDLANFITCYRPPC